jgi:hypothetical protein
MKHLTDLELDGLTSLAMRSLSATPENRQGKMLVSALHELIEVRSIIESLEAENKRLSEALRPFAEHAQRILAGKRGPLALTSDETMYAVRFGDLRRAAEAMKGGAE